MQPAPLAPANCRRRLPGHPDGRNTRRASAFFPSYVSEGVSPMRHVSVILSSWLVLLLPVAALAQSAQDQSVPRLINITGVFRPADGQPAGPVATVTLSIYADQQGGAPLWQETQTVALDAQGRYSLLLGA